MKNLFKLGFLGFALTLFVAACNQPENQNQDAEEVEIITEEDAVIDAETDTNVIEELEIDTNQVN